MAAAAPDDARAGGPRAGNRKRRTFALEYKRRVLAEFDQALEPGARGALLRREGLYHSHIQDWRRTLAAEPPAPTPTRTRKEPERESAETRRLQRENERLRKELEKTRAVMEILGKTHALLETLSESADTPKP